MRRIAALCAALLAPLAAAAEDAPPSTPSAAEAAISSDSDFVARLDVRAIQESSFVSTIFGDRITEWSGRLAPAGIGVEDVLHVLVAARSETIDAEAPAARDRSRGFPAVVAVALAKPLDLERLSSGLAALWAGRRSPGRSKLGDQDVLELRSENPEDPVLYAALSIPGTTVFLSTHRQGLQEALARERSGRFEKTPEALARLDSTLPERSEARTVLRVAAFGQKRAGQELTMSERVLQPFREIQTLALAVDFAEEATIHLVGEMPDQDAARRLGTLLGTLVLPNLKRVLSERLGNSIRLEDTLSVETDGATMRLSLELTSEELKAVSGPR
jgi:hypothetical protein